MEGFKKQLDPMDEAEYKLKGICPDCGSCHHWRECIIVKILSDEWSHLMSNNVLFQSSDLSVYGIVPDNDEYGLTFMGFFMGSPVYSSY